MATITAGEFRNGKTFEMDGKIFQVVEFQHVKPGKGAAFVRTKMRNIIPEGGLNAVALQMLLRQIQHFLRETESESDAM